MALNPSSESNEKRRRLIKRAGLVLGVLFVASILDGFICTHLDGKHLIRALPGTRQAISGDLDQPVRRPEEVAFRFEEGPGLALTIAEVRGRFWRGTVNVPSGAHEGIYRLNVSGGSGSKDQRATLYRIQVFDLPAALNDSYPSFIRRFFGFSPWWVAVVAAPLLVACLAFAFILPESGNRLSSKEGIAPIVKLARRKDHWEVAAAFFPDAPIAEGSLVDVVDKNRQPLTPMTVARIENGLVHGQVGLNVPIRPGGYIRYKGSG
ncbi:uncharacterized protein Dvar_25930 [Desulfosarcina variabilis str. Montpellier]|uniref:hypothetical protein n=1 Tax=Desulfosarcina variabilis TaxID=2300 RepID=UPI003AFAAA75